MDRRADPVTGIPLSTLNDDTFGRIFCNQSRNCCFAMKSLLGKDCERPTKSSLIFLSSLRR
jgi:hypothetical protein